MMLSRFATWFNAAPDAAVSHPSAWPSVTWRMAEADNWPPAELLPDDFDWARRTGTGFVADFQGKRWFLFHRDWFGWPDPPEWSLASFGADREGWRFYDDFDLLPDNWDVPKAQNAQD